MKKRKMPLLGHDTEVMEVEILEKKERAAEYVLEDGSVIRFQAVPTSVLRLEGQFDTEGNPIYIVLNGSVVTVVSAPAEVRRQ